MSRRRNNHLRRYILKIMIIPCMIFIVFLGGAILRQVVKTKSISRDISIIEKEITRLEVANAKVTSNLDYYKTVNFMEKEARTKIGMKKQGENVAVIINNENTEEIIIPEENRSFTNLSNPEKWFYYFFRKELL